MGQRQGDDAPMGSQTSGRHFRQEAPVASSVPSGASAPQAPRGPRHPRRKLLSTALIVVGCALLLVAAGMFGYAQWQYHKQDEVNARLAQFVSLPADQATTDGGSQSDGDTPQVDWAGLKAVNDDVVGWIQIPGTVVNYPVYQGETNETYLRTSATGEYSVGGQIFMDYENAKPGLVDGQTLVYGHHLMNGEMFAVVDEMADQSYFDGVKTIWYVTEQGSYELEPLLFYRTPATNGDARRTQFASADELHAYLKGLLGEASAKSASADMAINQVSKVLTLATCDYDNDFGKGNGRGLVVCALKSEVHPATGTEGSS